MIDKKEEKKKRLDSVVKSKIKGMGLDALFHMVDISKKDHQPYPSGDDQDDQAKHKFVQKLKEKLHHFEPQKIRSLLQQVYDPKVQNFIGIVLDECSIQIMHFRTLNGKLELARANHIPVPHAFSISEEKLETFTREAIAETFDAKTLKTTYLCSLIPRNKIILKFISFPTTEESEIEKMLEFEAEHHLPFSLNELEYDYQILNQEHGSTNVILAAIKKDIIRDHLKFLEKIGIRPKAIDITSNILYYSQTSEKYAKGRTVQINIAEKFTDINIIDDGIIKSSRGISWGNLALTERLSKKLNVNLDVAGKMKSEYGIVLKKSIQNDISESISQLSTQWAEDLISQINETFRQYQLQVGIHKIDRIILTGAGSRLINLDEYLKNQFKVMVIKAQPSDDLELSERSKEYMKFKDELSFVTGLPQRMSLPSNQSLNLLPKELRQSDERKKTRSQQLTTLGLLGAALLLFIIIPIGALNVRGLYMGYLDARIKQIKPKAAIVQELKDKIQTVEDYASIKYSCLEFLRELSTMVGLDTIIKNFYFEKNNSIILSGEAGSHASVVDLSRAVRESEYFKEATLLYSRRINRISENVDFEIICHLIQ